MSSTSFLAFVESLETYPPINALDRKASYEPIRSLLVNQHQRRIPHGPFRFCSCYQGYAKVWTQNGGLALYFPNFSDFTIIKTKMPGNLTFY